MAKLSVGQALLKAKSHIEVAQKLYHTILQSMPDNIQAQQSLNVLSNLEQLTATQGPPQETINQLVNLYNQGQLTAVVEQAEALTEQYPKAFIIWNVLGAAHKGLGKTFEASEAFKKVTELNPIYADGFNNLGVTLQEQGKLEEAIEEYNKALELKPDYADAYYNMGVTFKEQGKLEEAIEACQKALTLKPDFAEAYTNMSFAYLCKGSLEEGFKLNEWRLKKKKRTVAPARAIFIWDGKQSLNNKRFVAYAEQGLGDMIQFCRYLPFLEQKGADVTFKVKPALHALLQTMDSDVTLSTTDADEGQIDFEAPLMSLPHLFKTHLKTIPSMNPYLYADHARTKTWGERLHTDRFKIGICWQGSMAKIDVGRSFPLSLFEGISKAPNVELISLHKGEGEHQIKDISFDLTTLGADFDVGQDAFLDTAAVMMNCDLIITSDTAIAHLAGALGCQTWVALKHVPDWRWMLNRSDSPWYPTMTLYRQKTPGNWADVFSTVEQKLLSKLEEGK